MAMAENNRKRLNLFIAGKFSRFNSKLRQKVQNQLISCKIHIIRRRNN